MHSKKMSLLEGLNGVASNSFVSAEQLSEKTAPPRPHQHGSVSKNLVPKTVCIRVTWGAFRKSQLLGFSSALVTQNLLMGSMNITYSFW